MGELDRLTVSVPGDLKRQARAKAILEGKTGDAALNEYARILGIDV